jgi:hypothetical protein
LTIFKKPVIDTAIFGNLLKTQIRRIEARSSGGERYLDAVEVWGSNPHVPTIEPNLSKSET